VDLKNNSGIIPLSTKSAGGSPTVSQLDRDGNPSPHYNEDK